MFLDNKYYRWYLAITAKDDEIDGYTEKHHRIPKSMGGGGGDNLVKLTYRKHYLAHWLLVKCTEGKNKKKMYSALSRMAHRRKGSKKFIASWQYALSAHAKREAMRGNKIGLGRFPNDETRALLSKLRMGKQLSPETCIKVSLARLGMKFTDEHKKNLSLKKLGRKRKPFTEETIIKMRIASAKREALKREKFDLEVKRTSKLS